MTKQHISNWVKLRVVSCLGIFATIFSANAASVTVSWNANTEANLVGYRVYYGTASASYSASKLVASPATSTVISNLTDSTTYYFSVAATNSAGLEGIKSVEVSATMPAVTPANTPPTAIAQSVSTAEDTARGITLSGSDADGDALTLTVVAVPAHGTLSGVSPNLTYTPAANYSGADAFTFYANDGTTNSASATITINVTAVNDAPVAIAQSVTASEDTAKSITLAGTDVEGGTLTYTIVASPTHGTLAGSGAARTYTPTVNYTGSDSFTFKVNDGALDSTVVTVAINVTAVNDAPTAIAQSVTTTEDAAKTITLSGTDPEGGALTYAIVTTPANGTLTGTGASRTYTPNANFNGADSFTFKANDGALDSAAATVSISVTAANDAPVAVAQSVSTSESTPKAITLTATDVDNNPLTYSVVTAPAHGTLSGTAPNLTYTPTTSYNGPDSFTFKANDGTADSAVATVSITVSSVNDAPVAIAQTVSTAEDAAKAITLSATDADGNPLTYAVVAAPAHGSLTGTAPNLTYTPAAGYNGPDSLTFKANDGTVDSAIATVSITVTAVNDAPAAIAQSVSTAEDTAKVITLAGTDADNDPLNYTIVAAPAHGSLSGTAPNLTYTPTANYNGGDSFSFRVNDGTTNSAAATVTITVSAVNDAPVAVAQSIATPEDNATAITLAGTDVENNPLTFAVVTAPAHGTLGGTPPNLVYTPATNYSGADSFTFKANDGAADSAIATVAIAVSAVNDAPVAVAQSVSTTEDTAKAITLTGSDVESSPLTYLVVTPPLHGTLSGTAPNLTYRPATNYAGPDSFSFRVNDGQWDSDPATITLSVGSGNDAPVAIARSVTATEDTATAIALAATDADADVLTYSVTAAPAHGTLSGVAPNLTYTPADNYSGADSFAFKANDGIVDSAVATVSITVTAVNDTPTANALSLTTAEDAAAAVTLTGSDVEGSALAYIIVTPPASGTLTGSGANLTYRPATNFSGADSFTFKVNDGQLDSAVALVSISVTPVNDAPVAVAQSITTLEDTAKPVTLAGADAEGGALTYTLVTQPAHGKLTGTAPNVTYTPATNYNGLDSFSFKVNDGALDSAPATVSITVAGGNDAPVASSQSIATDEDTAKAITLGGTDADGNTLTFTVTTPPTHGALSGTAPNLVYTPTANYNGSDSFWFKANDGLADSALAVVTITVNTVNDAPVANNQAIATAEDTAKALTLSGSDVEGSALTFSVVAAPLHGTLGGAAPNLTYTPAANYNGADSFTFKANDGTSDSALATVSINVTAVNDAPVAAAQSVTTAEDAAKAITLAGSDVDGGTLSYVIVSGPAHGTLNGVAPGLTYSPAPNYSGPDSFSFKVNDGTADSTPATVSITVTSVNDAPVADAQTIATDRNVARSFTLTGSDADGDSLTFALVALPTLGTLSGTAPNLTYLPNTNVTGSDMLTFRVNDGATNSAIAVVTINIAAGPNVAPVAIAQDVTTAEDAAKPVTLSGTDIDGNALTYTVTTPPAHGTLSGTAPNLSYTPATNYNGSDTFWFKANDGALDSALAAISITVTPVNDAPAAGAQSVATVEDTAKSITLTAFDADIDALTFSVVAGPAHGTLSGTAPNLTYTPASNYNGPDSFTFKANDGKVDSASATVSLTVTPANDAPVASAQSVTTPEDTAKAVTLAATDADGNSLNYSVVSAPASGTLSGTAPNLIYTPGTNFNGADSFTFKANDGTADSTPATVSITVTPVNDPPAMNALANVTIDQDAPSQTVTLTGISPGANEVQPLTITAASSNPSLITAPTVIYTDPSNLGAVSFAPVAGASGSAVITITLNDGQAANNIATRSFTVTVNAAAPSITMDPITNVTLDENSGQQALTITGISGATAGGTGVGASAITITATSSNPALVPDPVVEYVSPSTTATLRFAPVPNVAGKAIITVTVNDGVNKPLARSFTIFINDVNAAPTLDAIASLALTNSPGQQILPLTGISAGVGESQPLTVTATSSNPSLIPTPLVNYTTPNATGSIVFTPTANASGSAVITVRVSDGQITNGFTTRSFTVTVAPAAQAPAIALTSPVANTSATTPATIDLAVAITANGHTINKVQYFNSNTLIGESSTAPYSASWTATNSGSATLVARLYYDGGNTVDSTPVSIVLNSLPAPWVLQDVGSLGSSGSALVSNDVFSITGTGYLVSGSDKFAFVHEPLIADGEMKVQVSSPGSLNGSRSGIMIRDSLAAGSKFAFLGISPDGYFRWMTRTSTGGKVTTASSRGAEPGAWVRLVRNGKNITGYQSTDGSNWTRCGSVNLTMAANIQIGMAVTSGSATAANTASYNSPVVVP